MENCAHKKKKMRSEEEKKKLLNRICRIEGQIRAIKSMIDDDAYCIDILTQISAASGALRSLSDKMLICHIKSCVSEGIEKKDPSVANELADVIEKLNK